jgi:hypothetical protein
VKAVKKKPVTISFASRRSKTHRVRLKRYCCVVVTSGSTMAEAYDRAAVMSRLTQEKRSGATMSRDGLSAWGSYKKAGLALVKEMRREFQDDPQLLALIALLESKLNRV